MNSPITEILRIQLPSFTVLGCFSIDFIIRAYKLLISQGGKELAFIINKSLGFIAKETECDSFKLIFFLLAFDTSTLEMNDQTHKIEVTVISKLSL